MKLEYIQHMGSDSSVVDAARVSMDKMADQYSPEQNEKLIKYLVKNNHWSPLAHPQISFRVSMPIFLARQYFKHIVGSVKNECSRRYVQSEPTFFYPEWRHAPKGGVKQGSGEPMDLNSPSLVRIEQEYEKLLVSCECTYFDLIDEGVAPEQARMVLPQSMMTEIIDTGSLVYWARMYQQRAMDDHAQKEWKLLMDPLNEKMLELFPISWRELTKERA